MLRSIIGRLTGGRGRPAAGRRAGAGPTAGAPGRSAEREIAQGAKSVARGVSRKRRR